MTEFAQERAPEPEERPVGPALVVGLGASAGGIDALSEFFRQAPPEAPFAYVVILHLSPDHDSRLADVLQHATAMPVTQVRQPERLEARHVYVISPNQSLRVADGTLVLSPVTRTDERRSPVDIFFRALADAYGPNAAAVILSGTGADGSSGLKRVKEQGGLTIAQHPDEARFAEMPANAIATGLVDYVLPVAEMATRMVRFADGMRRGLATIVVDETAPENHDALRDVLGLLRTRTGHDFANYKLPTLKRRIARRMSLHGAFTLADYARVMRDQPDEPVLLMKELLISVTNFFRDAEAFAALEGLVIPRLFGGRRRGDHVRVWSAGCATGEEAYSLAMVLMEHASTLSDPPAIQVFGTDLDGQAIATARQGAYGEADVADVTPERLGRFFQRETAGYRVRREVRELVLFAEHNVLTDPPFSHVDLIACRNLLIYLNRDVQGRVFETFHFALRPGGYLFLGGSESPEGVSPLFAPVDKAAHLYEGRLRASRAPAPLHDRAVPLPPEMTPRPRAPRPSARIWPADLHLRLLEQFAPPSLVVNEEHTVVHMSERAGQYLQMAGGEPSRDLMSLVHPDVRPDLRTALHLARQQRSEVAVRGARLPGPDARRTVTIIIRPVLRGDEGLRGYFLVLFSDEEAGAASVATTAVLESAGATASTHTGEEVERLRAQLRATVEQYETQGEEQKASNEELQAMNEELRASTEELETGREELQSTNEELTTVNQELKVKLEELRIANNDLQNLINSAEIGAIFLDRSLRVKLSTPRARDVFNLLPADTGRRLTDITSQLVYPELTADVTSVLETLRPVEREVAAADQRWYYVHVVPYRTSEDRIDGVVITLLDVTRRQRAEGRVLVGEERLRLLIDSAVDYAIFTMTPDGRIDSWNSGAERLFGYRADEIVGQNADVLFTPEDRAAGIPQQELEGAARAGRALDERWHIRKGGSRFYCSGVTTRLGDAETLGFAKIARDLTQQRQTEMAVERMREELEARVDERTAALQAEVAQHAAARDDVSRLLQRVVTAQEEERARIARDLHDQLGQQLTALRMTLERHRAQCAAAGGPDDVDRALAQAGHMDDELDFLAWELRPAVLDDLGFGAALPRFLQEWSAHYGIASQFHAASEVAGLLSPEVQVTFYRVAQEALNNVVKHAHASRVDVVLERRDGSVVLVVEDNGIGFDPAAAGTADKGIGLAGMRERAALIGADFQIESAPGKGTTIYLRCELAEPSR